MRVLLSLTFFAAVLCGQSAFADLIVTEVMSSSNAPPAPNALNGFDWWELTNTGPAAVSLNGYSWEDSPVSNDRSIFPNGINVAVGESIIIHQGSGTALAFRTAWGLPGTVQVLDESAFTANMGNTFSGLSGTNDQVNLFNGSNVLVDNATFAASTLGVSFEYSSTNVDLALSVVGENGAYQITYPAPNANALKATGSPGISAGVPEPTSVLLALLAAVVGACVRRR